MCCFTTTNLSPSLLVKEFFLNGEHLAKLGTKYLFHAPHLPCAFVCKDAELAK